MKRFFFNYKVDKYELTRFFSWFIQAYGSAKTTQFADTLKYVGFHYAMRAGISIGIEDLQIPPAKYTLVENAKTTLLQTTLSCERGTKQQVVPWLFLRQPLVATTVPSGLMKNAAL